MKVCVGCSIGKVRVLLVLDLLWHVDANGESLVMVKRKVRGGRSQGSGFERLTQYHALTHARAFSSVFDINHIALSSHFRFSVTAPAPASLVRQRLPAQSRA